MKIAVAGLGYVGLSNSLLLAKQHQVVAFDIDQNKIDLLNKGISPVRDDVASDYLKNKSLNLKATLDSSEAVKDADLLIVATPTNYDPAINEFDLSSVYKVIKEALEVNPNIWILIKSTIGIGHTEHLINKFNTNKILFSPEFLREGKALYDNLYPSRIIVGVINKDEEHLAKAKEIIDIFVASANKENILTQIVGVKEAEAIKLFSNTFLAMRVSYFNEIDTFAMSKDLNTEDIIKGVCADPRIGDYYNNPSFGYGGYCLSKDTKELRADYKDIPQNLVDAVIDSNETRIKFLANKIKEEINFNKDSIIGVYRLVMKANSDNFRNPAVLEIVKLLKEDGYRVVIHEPVITNKTYLDFEINNDIDSFKSQTSIILVNRNDTSLNDVKYKIFTRDIFVRD